MIPVYESYLEKKKVLTFEEMTALHSELAEEIGEDPEALELYNDLVAAATRYSPIRANWLFWSPEERGGNNDNRTICHNGLIARFDALAAYLRQQGKSAAWRDELGYEEEEKVNRKRIGDFGCYIVFINSISAR